MARGLIIAFSAYLFLSFGYVFVKIIGRNLSTFEVNFFVAFFSSFIVIFSRPPQEKWLDTFRMKRPLATIGRSLAGITSGILGVYAFSRISFADAYTLLFLAPSFTLVLSIVFLNEKVDRARWVSVGLGLIGVLIAVRPSFEKVDVAYGAAVAAAFLTAVSVVTLRSIGNSERHVSIVGVLIALAMISNGALMMQDFVMPSSKEFMLLASAGFCSGMGTLLMIAALRSAPANFVAPTQYSQLVFAALFSLLVFGENIDLLKALGMGLIIVSGALAFTRGRRFVNDRLRASVKPET